MAITRKVRNSEIKKVIIKMFK